MSRAEPLERLAEGFCREEGLLEPGERVLVGLSGGADSVALLHFLRFGLGCEVSACHVNHGLREAESLRDEDFARKLSAEWGIPFYLRQGDVRRLAEGSGRSVEEAGRDFRYACFEECRSEAGAEKIATAHTRSDQAETLLLNLLRGSGIQGLCGIPPKRGRIVRPLLRVSREEVEEYCRRWGLAYVTDSSNSSLEYTRNRVRLEVLPLLRELNPQAEQTLAQTTEVIRPGAIYLAEAVGLLLEEAQREKGWQASALAGAPAGLRRQAAWSLLKKLGILPSFIRVQELDRVICGEIARMDAGKGRYFVRRKGLLCLEEAEGCPSYSFPLEPGEFALPCGECYRAMEIPAETAGSFQKVYKKLLYLLLDYDKIKGKALLRQRLPGDRIRLAGRGCSKSLKKLQNEAGLSRYEREAFPVLADEEGCVAAFPFGIAERVRADDSSRRLLAVFRLEEKDQTEFDKKT